MSPSTATKKSFCDLNLMGEVIIKSFGMPWIMVHTDQTNSQTHFFTGSHHLPRPASFKDRHNLANTASQGN